MTNETARQITTETIYVRKWTNAEVRDRGDLPEEIVKVTHVTDPNAEIDDVQQEVFTDSEQVARVHQEALEAERNIRNGND